MSAAVAGVCCVVLHGEARVVRFLPRLVTSP